MITACLITLCAFIFFPHIKLNGKKYEKVKVNTEYNDAGVIVKGLLKNMNYKINITKNIDTTKCGKYTIVYTLSAHKIKSKVIRIVEVYDERLPVIFNAKSNKRCIN